MNFLIQIENGMPVNHPILEQNLQEFIDNLDINNPPTGWARFVRKEPPEILPHQKIHSVEYGIDSELSEQYKTTVWTDKYNIVDISDKEIMEMAINIIRQSNELMRINMNAPYPAPDDGEYYIWSDSSNKWILKPSNFDEVITEYSAKLKELGLEYVSPDELETIQEDKRLQLQQIINQLNL